MAQPMDAGYFSLLKAILRRLYSAWAMFLVMSHMAKGGDPETVQLPLGLPSMRNELLCWLGEAFKEMTTPESTLKVAGYWTRTGLDRAWDPRMQAEAVSRGKSAKPPVTTICAL